MEQCFSVLPHVDFMHVSSMNPIIECVKDPPGGRPFRRIHILSLGIWMGRQVCALGSSRVRYSTRKSSKQRVPQGQPIRLQTMGLNQLQDLLLCASL